MTSKSPVIVLAICGLVSFVVGLFLIWSGYSLASLLEPTCPSFGFNAPIWKCRQPHFYLTAGGALVVISGVLFVMAALARKRARVAPKGL